MIEARNVLKRGGANAWFYVARASVIMFTKEVPQSIAISIVLFVQWSCLVFYAEYFEAHLKAVVEICVIRR